MDDLTETALQAQLEETRADLRDSRARLDETRVELDELRALVTGLCAARDRSPTPAGTEVPEHTADEAAPTRSVTRRRLFGLAAAGAGSIALATTTGVEPAAANDPYDLTIGETKTNPSTGVTVLNNLGQCSGAQVLFQSGDGLGVAQFEPFTALGGFASDNGLASYGVSGISSKSDGLGVYGVATQPTGVGVSGRGFEGRGGTFRGAIAALRLEPYGLSGPPSSGSHDFGDLQSFADGVWLCVAYGTPGTWRKIQGAATAGAFHPIAPARVYDSRVVGARTAIAAGQTWVIDVANQINAIGWIVRSNIVPAGATAIVANLTVVLTDTGPGYLSVTPSGGQATSSINWTGYHSVVANGLTTAVTPARQVSVYANRATHFLLDVSGYYL